MLLKITREDSLKNYPNFPLRHYDHVLDEEEYYYPEVFATHWLTLDSEDKEKRPDFLVSELTQLIRNLGYNKLIFLGDTEQCWISNLSVERDDYEPLNKALQYLASNNIAKDFNGSLQVETQDLSEFLVHFYCLTRCDASLPYFHFMDIDQNFVGFIHYSGEVRIDTLNKTADRLFQSAVRETKLIKAPAKNK